MTSAKSANRAPSLTSSEGEFKLGGRNIANVAVITLVILSALYLFDRLYQPESFLIENLTVSGRLENVDSMEVKHLIERSLDGNFFSVDLSHIENEVEKLPWVFNAAIRRQWPSSIHVDISEIQPVAAWGESQWLHYTGDLIDRESSIELDGMPFLDGPISLKDKVWEHYRKWSTLFSKNGLTLNEVKLDEMGIWWLQISLGELYFDQVHRDAISHTVAVTVTDSNVDRDISRFIQALNTKLITDFLHIESVDLRYPNGFAVNWIDLAKLDQLTVMNVEEY